MLIALVFVASVAAISFFGMRMKVYNEVIPVSEIVCLNETSGDIKVTDGPDNRTVIQTKFTTPADKTALSGTMIQLMVRVLPDNATTKGVRYVYDTENPNVEFYETESGEQTGLVLFYNKAVIEVKVMSTDGRRVEKKLTVAAL